MYLSNKKKRLYYTALTLIGGIVTVASFLLLIVRNKDKLFLAISIIAMIFGLVFTAVFTALLIENSLRRSAISKKSFSRYIDNIVADEMGVIIYDNTGTIIWVSSFINRRFKGGYSGNTLLEFYKDVKVDFDEKAINSQFWYENNYYEATLNPFKNYLKIVDKTLERRSITTYEQEIPVLGELEIDNYQLFQSIISDEDLYNVTKNVIQTLDYLSNKYNFVYRQYNDNGRFLILTNKLVLQQLEKDEFKVFAALHDCMKTDNKDFMVSVSIGFALGTMSYKEKNELAKKALMQAQSRGGDQIVIMGDMLPTRYYGSTNEILPTLDRTKSKVFSKRIGNKLSNPMIKNVLVFGHKNADLDALGSAYATVKLAESYGIENCKIVGKTFDNTCRQLLSKYPDKFEKYIIKNIRSQKYDPNETAIFIVDIAYPDGTDFPDCLENMLSDNVFVIDHHRLRSPINFTNKSNTLVDPSASSASELISEIIIFTEHAIKVEPFTAQMLLNGIYLDTTLFQKKTSARTFEIAAWLEGRGANSVESSETLKISPTNYENVVELLNNIQEVKPGFYLAYKDIPVANDLVSVAADEILRIGGRKASFVVAATEDRKGYKLSARGIGTNVQKICEAVGGGGHFSSAAAVTNENLETFIDNIKQAIVSVKDESNIN
ncbi:GGDEF domain-containing protein [Mycoplasmopsis opalescens]|uniref:DHH family phosphoesterase n=1 Tax=Mycoplasmopsis opalescens TaxID=114886 RepID=UPI0004A75637|nr:DHH family phosphoesterase [Mycoplasmopsis opalescens]